MLPAEQMYDRWAVIGDLPAGLAPGRRVPGLDQSLEAALSSVVSDWWRIGKQLSTEPSAELGHTPACASNLSDFGLMLAWAQLVAAWSVDTEKTLVVIDDPWMFRHLASFEGVVAGPQPVLWRAELKLWLRGRAARVSAAVRFFRYAIQLGRFKGRAIRNRTAILVYGHPTSTAEGQDGYFGGMMRDIPDVDRVLHVDCLPARARELMKDGRTHSLHSWGNPLAAPMLLGARWRPSAQWKRHTYAWLIRRAAAREAGMASGAALRWQQHCQQRWLKAVAPATVAWPWENHSWERVFVRDCRTQKISTVGYQHSVIGPLMQNYSPASVRDGVLGIPDLILTTGELPAAQLREWGVPDERLRVGGAWRIARQAAVTFSEDAPVFLPLPFDLRVAAEMVAAANSVPGKRFLVKEHPMTPFGFDETDHLRRTDRPLGEHKELSAVVYAATTVGLESLLAGLPTFRFRPRTCMAIDILPAGQSVDVVDADTMGDALRQPQPVQPPERDAFFAPVNLGLWRRHLNAEA